jgi:hypothetical protein
MTVSCTVILKKGESLSNIESRLDLLSGLRSLHSHAHELTLALSPAAEDQQRRLAIAFRLDFPKDGKTATWPALLWRRIPANAVPGLTPLKGKIPEPILDGQIKVPCAAPPSPPPPDNIVQNRSCRATVCKPEAAKQPAVVSDARNSHSDATASAEDDPYSNVGASARTCRAGCSPRFYQAST